jgi:hypothetical protein
MEINLCLKDTIFHRNLDQRLCLFFVNKTDYYQYYVQVPNMFINKQQIIYRNAFINIFIHRPAYD